MDARQERGLVIAATFKLTKKGKAWKVPSQTGNGKTYTVCPDEQEPFCSCPDHETHGGRCKHIYAVEFVIQRELFPDGSEVVTQSVSITETIERKTYAQPWAQYNAAQVNEKDHFLALLHDLTKNIQDPEQKTGRPRVRMSDAVFSAVFKIYSTVSSRRFMSDLRAAKDKGYVTRAIHFNSVLKALESEALSPILKELVAESSKPLACVEDTFAVDSTGFAGSRFERWFDYKHNKERTWRTWTKAQLMSGTRTHVVTSVTICDHDGADSPYLPELVRETAKNFTVKEVSADKGYSSVVNHEVIADVGATPYIAFKKVATGFSGGLWAKMLGFFMFQREEFLKKYHRRSNIESTMHMIKSKFRDHVRSKTPVAMRNEVLCKILAHNICCLISAMYELGIDPTLCAEKSDAHKALAV